MNRFDIVISATDKASAVARKVNNSMGKLMLPFTNFQKNMSVLSKTAGLDKIATGVLNVGRAATGVMGQLHGLLGPLLAISAGGIAAGIVSLALAWGMLGFQVQRSATAIGVSVNYLQSMRGAAIAAGLGADEMTSSIHQLGMTLEDALFGRNQQALMLLNQLGVGIHRSKDGVLDTARAFREVANSISAIRNAQAQETVANLLGVGPMLPLIRRGSSAIDSYVEKIKALSYVQSNEAVAAATRFQESMNLAHVQVDSLKMSIGDKLIPVFQPLIDKFNGMSAAEKDVIAQKIVDMVKELVDWLPKAAKGVNTVVDAFGGWTNVLYGFGTIMLLNAIAPTVLLIEKLGILAFWMVTRLPIAAGLMELAVVSSFARMTTAMIAGNTLTAASFALLGTAIWLAGGALAALVGVGLGLALGKLIDKVVGFFTGVDSLGAKIYDWTHGGAPTFDGSARPKPLNPSGGFSSLTDDAVGVRRSGDSNGGAPFSLFITAPEGTKVEARKPDGSHMPVQVATTMPRW